MKTLIARESALRRVSNIKSEVQTLIQALESAGYTSSIDSVTLAWLAVSDDHCAQWMGVDDFTPEELVDLILKYLEPQP